MIILCLSPHTDDAELGAGASMAGLCKVAHRVISVAFSDCDSTKLPDEFRRSSAILATEHLLIPFERRTFTVQRQNILNLMIDLRNRYDPDIVFTPSSNQIHQDHQVIHEETKRAFRCNIYGYEQVWNSTAQNLVVGAEITEGNLNNKITALSMYESQQERPYFKPSFIRSLAEVRGVQFGVPLAEAFEAIRVKL